MKAALSSHPARRGAFGALGVVGLAALHASCASPEPVDGATVSDIRYDNAGYACTVTATQESVSVERFGLTPLQVRLQVRYGAEATYPAGYAKPTGWYWSWDYSIFRSTGFYLAAPGPGPALGFDLVRRLTAQMPGASLWDPVPEGTVRIPSASRELGAKGVG